MTGETPKELLDLVELPEVFHDCWEWFIDLYNSRSVGMASANPISFTDMYSYFQLMQVEPDPWEIKVIKMFDSIAMQIEHKQMKQTQQENKNKKKPK